MNKKIENKELIKRILERLNKSEIGKFSEEELAKIENIAFTKKLANGTDTGIGIENIFLFENLRCLTLRSYSLTMEDLQYISEQSTIENVSFLECTFDNIDFDELPRVPEVLKFLNCSKLPLKFPRVKKVMIGNCEIDFDSIDFSSASSIIIKNSKIKNAHDISECNNILEVNLDGSELLQKDGDSLEDIRVPDNCKYSHKEDDKYYIDDYNRISEEDYEK